MLKSIEKTTAKPVIKQPKPATSEIVVKTTEPVITNTKEPKKNIKKKKGLLNHLKSIGFTNRLAVYLIIFLIFGLIGGFILAILSIKYNYTGQLLCWTVVFTPLGTCISIVLGKIVDKNRDENTGGNGDGIKFAAAQASKFIQSAEDYIDSENSPRI